MAGRTLDVSVLVRLVDRLTSPLRAIRAAFERVLGLIRRIGVLGGAIAAISFMAPIQQAAAFDQKLRDMVVTAGLWGDAAETRIRAVKAELFDLALQVGLTSDALTDALAALTSAGMDETLSRRLLPTIGRVAKAASALPTDVARVGFELSNTFGIAADKLEENFAKLIVAGKLGRFEFKDMAKAIPTLSNALKGLGVTGSEAVAHMGAALQIAMLGADSAETAANNYKNFLTKVLAPDAAKNFEKLGVNIEAVMSNAVAKGINPVEAALEKISGLTGASQREIDAVFKAGKGKGMTNGQAADEVKAQIKAIMARTKLGQLFADTQVLDFLVPFMLNKSKFKDFKAAIQAAGLDEMARDFKTQMAGLGTQVTIFNQILDIFKDRVGIAFGSNMDWINQGLMTLLGYVKMVDAAFPGVIDQVLSFGGAALVLVTGLGLLGPVMSIIGAGLGIIGGVIGAILSPIGLLIAGVALLAAKFVNWQAVGRGVMNFVRWLVAQLPAAGRILRGLGTMFGSMASTIGERLSWVGDAWNRFTGWLGQTNVWKELQTAAGGAVDWVGRKFDELANMSDADWRNLGARLGTAISDGAAGLYDAGAKFIQELWDGAKAKFTEMLSWLTSIPDRIKDAISGALPSIDDWTKGAPAPGSNDNKPAAPGGSGASGSWAPAPGKQSFAPMPGRSQLAQAAPQEPFNGRIVVEGVNGATVREASSDNRNVTMVAGRGQVIRRA